MASKHDAKRARENVFAMQNNLARHKGQQFWMQKPVQPKIAKAPKAKPAPAPAPAEPATPGPASEAEPAPKD